MSVLPTSRISFIYIFLQILYYCFTIFNVISFCMYIPYKIHIGKCRTIYTTIYCSGAIIHFLILVLGVYFVCGWERNIVTTCFQVYYSFFILSAIDFFVALVEGKGTKDYDSVSSRSEPRDSIEDCSLETQ